VTETLNLNSPILDPAPEKYYTMTELETFVIPLPEIFDPDNSKIVPYFQDLDYGVCDFCFNFIGLNKTARTITINAKGDNLYVGNYTIKLTVNDGRSRSTTYPIVVDLVTSKSFVGVTEEQNGAYEKEFDQDSENNVTSG
jgi:hypothetical protein